MSRGLEILFVHLSRFTVTTLAVLLISPTLLLGMVVLLPAEQHMLILRWVIALLLLAWSGFFACFAVQSVRKSDLWERNRLVTQLIKEYRQGPLSEHKHEAFEELVRDGVIVYLNGIIFVPDVGPSRLPVLSERAIFGEV